MKDLNHAKAQLVQGGYTCVLCREEKCITSTLRGVKPLVAWLENGDDVHGFSAADKVVGKATAFLYVLLGVRAVYAHVISKGAYTVLTDAGITVEYASLADHIINRTGDGICPFEEAVMPYSDPQQAYSAIRRKMTAMGISL